MKTVKKFNLLTSSWTDGYSFIPVSFNKKSPFLAFIYSGQATLLYSGKVIFLCIICCLSLEIGDLLLRTDKSHTQIVKLIVIHPEFYHLSYSNYSTCFVINETMKVYILLISDRICHRISTMCYFDNRPLAWIITSCK